MRQVVLGLASLAAACSNLLGISPPHDRDAGPAQAGFAGNDAGDAGDQGAGGGGDAGQAQGGYGGDTFVGGSASASAGDSPGGAGGCDTTAPALSLELSGSARACTGRVASVTLEARGGVPPYAWALQSGAAGFGLDSSKGPAVTLSGTASAAGAHAFDIVLHDSCGHALDYPFSLDVGDPPRVETQTLPEGCSDTGYTWPLAISGGDPTSYKLSSPNLPEDLGLHFEGGSLSGRLASAGSYLFDVGIGDDFCPPDAGSPASLALSVHDISSCPVSPLDVQFSNLSEPPAPCRGYAYQALFRRRASAGAEVLAPPLTWQDLAMPPGFQKSESNATQILTIEGTVAQPSTVTILIKDAASRQLLLSYGLVPRDKCWLAFVSPDESAVSRLYLSDPLLGSDLSFPSSAISGSVRDFKFSPDGQFLAYRIESSGSSSLVVLQAPSWQEQLLDFAGSIESYAWSPKSSLLAVSFQDGGDTRLGGIDASQASAAAGDASGITGIRVLSPAPVPANANLLWVGEASPFVAFQTIQSPSAATIGYAALDQPSAPTTFVDYTSLGTSYGAPELKAGPAGFFVLDRAPRSAAGTALHFFVPQLSSPAPLDYSHGDDVVSPSGAFTARIENSMLELFLAAANSASGASPQSSVPGCDTLLAWASDKERIACASDTGNVTAPGEVRIFDVNTNQTLGPPMTVSDVRLGDYTAGTALNHRRAFSPSGNWLALDTNDYFYLIDAHAGPRLFAKHSVFPGAHSDDIAFDSAEHYVLLQRDDYLAVYSLDDPDAMELGASDQSLVSASSCLETISSAPDQWCGRTNARSTSPVSPLAVHATADGNLEVVDLTEARTGQASYPPIAHVCAGCVDQFEFQP